MCVQSLRGTSLHVVRKHLLEFGVKISPVAMQHLKQTFIKQTNIFNHEFWSLPIDWWLDSFFIFIRCKKYPKTSNSFFIFRHQNARLWWLWSSGQKTLDWTTEVTILLASFFKSLLVVLHVSSLELLHESYW